MKEDNASSWSAPDLNATDSDTAAGSLTWSVETNASNGTATIAGTGTYPTTFTYVPNLNFYGSDSFVAQVSDGASTDTITVNVNVAPGLAPTFTAMVNGAGSVPDQTIVATVGSMAGAAVDADPFGTTPSFQLTPTAGSMTNTSVTAAPVGITPNFSLTPAGGSMGSISVSTVVVAATSDFQLTPVGGSMTTIGPVTAPWADPTSYTGQGSGYDPSETVVISIIAFPSFNSQTTTASVAGDGTLSFTLPTANEAGDHYISADQGTYFKIPDALDMGSGYTPGLTPAVTTNAVGDANGSAVAGADGRVDVTFVGNAGSASPITVSVASWYNLSTISFTGEGSGYHDSENGGALAKPLITITKPSQSQQEVNATVAVNGTLSFTLPIETDEAGNHVVSAATGTYYKVPTAYNKGSGYTPAVTPAVTVERGGVPVAGVAGSGTAGADGAIDVTFTGNAGTGAVTVTVADGIPAWTESVDTINVTTGGTNYEVNDLISLSGGGGTGATAKVATVGGSGDILTVAVTTAGSGYTTAPTATVDSSHKANTGDASVIDSSDSNATHPASKAFDGSTAATPSNRWSPKQLALPNVYLTWQFTNSFKVIDYKIKGQDELPGNRGPKDFKLQGSNNGASWTDLDVVTGETGWTANELRAYNVDNPGIYTYYKLLISAAEGVDTFLGLREVELWGGS